MQGQDQYQYPIAQGTPIQPYQQNNQMPVYQMNPPINLKPDLQPYIQNNTSNSPYPTQAKCLNCNQIFTTITTAKSGSGTYTWSFILCIFTGCFCIPFFVDSCKDKIHSCPRCQSPLGVYEYKLC